MSRHVEPRMHPVKISTLLPTQMTVGMAEVEDQEKEWRKILKDFPKSGSERLGRMAVPVILGPRGSYLIDHHHHCLALMRVGQDEVFTHIVASLQNLPPELFWPTMDARGWCHPYDRHGVRRGFDRVPSRLADLVDDPYRSLAGLVRDEGGYAKNAEPFSEFQWAGYLRWKMPDIIARDLRPKHRAQTVKHAVAQARSHSANYLPGWCGVR